MATDMKIFKDILAERKAIENKIAENENAFLEALAASGEVSIFITFGYTPGFNDGDPCEHTRETYIGVNAIDCSEVERYLEEIDDELDWMDEEAVTEAGFHMDGPSKEIAELIDTFVSEPVENRLETDYIVIYVLKDGKFKVTKQKFYCGY